MVVSVLEAQSRSTEDPLAKMGTVGQCLRLLAKEGLTVEGDIQPLLDRPNALKLLARRWRRVTHSACAESSGSPAYRFALASKRLEMIRPYEAQMFFDTDFNFAYFDPYENMPFGATAFEVFRDDYFLVPKLRITAKDVQPAFGSHLAHDWFYQLPAYSQDLLTEGWCLMSKGVVAGSVCEDVSVQEKVLPEGGHVASLAEVCYGIGLYYLARQYNLLSDSRRESESFSVRVSDCDEYGKYYRVHFDPERGFSLGYGCSTTCAVSQGIIAVIDPPQFGSS